ncbi:glycosyltransferase family 4 protein [Streptomyces chumphonensis]|uniref:glycosyltransferase family 4 protein n=1 Tax=Streptomyces chumphonensis TaxID=1214925 RepID=UPI003D72EC5A
MRVLHVIKEVTDGGASMGLLRMCADGPGDARPTVASLLPPRPEHRAVFERAGVTVLAGGEAARAAVAETDLVQVEWWNNPHVNDFLVNADLPPTRVLLHSRGHFDAPWMCPSDRLLARVDGCTVTTPSAAANPRFESNRRSAGLPPARCVFSSAGPVATAGPGPAPARREEGRITVGYLGTVEPIKMHAAMMEIVAGVVEAAPEVDFVFAGDGALPEYRAEVRRLGIGDRVRFLGFQDDPAAFLAGLDVFCYPLNPYTYATSEKALQEAMLAGLPCVALPVGGIRDLLTAESALLVETPAQCVDACLSLVRSPALRERLGRAARERIEHLTERRAWRGRLTDARAEVLARPAWARSGLGVDRVALFDHCTDRRGWETERMDEAQRADFARVAAFVEDDYAAWLESGPPRPDMPATRAERISS